MDPMRPKADSGLIDILALQRQAQDERAGLAEQRPSYQPFSSPLSLAPQAMDTVARSDDDDDVAAMRMSLAPKIPIKFAAAGAAGFVFLLLVGLAVAGTSSEDEAPKAAASAPKTAVAAAPPPPMSPAPQSVEPPAQPIHVGVATASTKVSAKPAHKGLKRHAGGGPKLAKVQSSGT
jgi:hypothetical protein